MTKPQQFAAAFASRQEAQDFLGRALPLATAGNPKYYAKADRVETQWLTKTIRFRDAPNGKGIEVAMDEDFTETRAGVSKPGTHQTVFALGDVGVSLETSASDVTASGEPASGILFACNAPQCIHARWNGQASAADTTDVYLQDPELRARIFAAFEFLKAIGDKKPS